VTEVGVFSLKMVPTESLEAGDVGYVAANIRDIREVPVGDTMTSAVRPADAPIPGFFCNETHGFRVHLSY